MSQSTVYVLRTGSSGSPYQWFAKEWKQYQVVSPPLRKSFFLLFTLLLLCYYKNVVFRSKQNNVGWKCQPSWPGPFPCAFPWSRNGIVSTSGVDCVNFIVVKEALIKVKVAICNEDMFQHMHYNGWTSQHTDLNITTQMECIISLRYEDWRRIV